MYLSGKSTEEVAAAAVDTAKEAKEELQQLVNWSATHHVRPKRFYQPETTEEVEDIVQKSHDQGIGPVMYIRRPVHTLDAVCNPGTVDTFSDNVCFSSSHPSSITRR